MMYYSAFRKIQDSKLDQLKAFLTEQAEKVLSPDGLVVAGSIAIMVAVSPYISKLKDENTQASTQAVQQAETRTQIASDLQLNKPTASKRLGI